MSGALVIEEALTVPRSPFRGYVLRRLVGWQRRAPPGRFTRGGGKRFHARSPNAIDFWRGLAMVRSSGTTCRATRSSLSCIRDTRSRTRPSCSCSSPAGRWARDEARRGGGPARRGACGSALPAPLEVYRAQLVIMAIAFAMIAAAALISTIRCSSNGTVPARSSGRRSRASSAGCLCAPARLIQHPAALRRAARAAPTPSDRRRAAGRRSAASFALYQMARASSSRSPCRAGPRRGRGTITRSPGSPLLLGFVASGWLRRVPPSAWPAADAARDCRGGARARWRISPSGSWTRSPSRTPGSVFIDG